MNVVTHTNMSQLLHTGFKYPLFYSYLFINFIKDKGCTDGWACRRAPLHTEWLK